MKMPTELDLSRVCVEVIPLVERDLDVTDLVSVIFLLYEDVHVALERLTLYLSLNRNNESSRDGGVSLLHDWAVSARSERHWKHKLVEALSICQCFGIIRKLKLNVNSVKDHYLPNVQETSLHIHPVKKLLHKLCEGFTPNQAQQFIEFTNDAVGANVCEDVDSNVAEQMIFNLEYFILKLVKGNYVKFGYYCFDNDQNLNTNSKCDLKVIYDVCQLMGDRFGEKLIEIEKRLNALDDSTSDQDIAGSVARLRIRDKGAGTSNMNKSINTCNVKLQLENYKTNNKTCEQNDKSVHSSVDVYPIHNVMDVGMCIIINQKTFRPTSVSDPKLAERAGTDKDKDRLEQTMQKFNIRCIVFENLRSGDIISSIQSVVNSEVQTHHSLFAVCVLSHGVKGAVYGTDSVPLKVSKIRESISGTNLPMLINKPKILIIQACQGNEMLKQIAFDGSASPIVADRRTVLEVSDILEYWSCLPNYVSLRDLQSGTWFIQTLCDVLDGSDGSKHVYELFTTATRKVTEKIHEDLSMHPMMNSSLRRHLYLPKPSS